MIADQDFLSAVGFVIESEGGYSNNPADSGGATMWGISWNNDSTWLIKHGYTKETMQNLTKDDATTCYYECYWLPSDAAGLTDPHMAYLHLDSSVQHGTGRAMAFLHNLPHNPKNYDFSNGKNSQMATFLFGKYFTQRLRYYSLLKAFTSFGRGWMSRCAEILDNANTDPGASHGL